MVETAQFIVDKNIAGPVMVRFVSNVKNVGRSLISVFKEQKEPLIY